MGASAPTFLFDFFKDLCYNKEKEQEDMSMEKIHPFAQLWRDIIDKYFEHHPSAGLALWTIPLDEQPEQLKVELYDILWTLTNNDTEQQKYTSSTLWEELSAAWARHHRSGGLTWWQLPLDEQPQDLKIEMYDIFWTLTHQYI